MLFLVSLLVDGALTGAIYALIALAFVVVYKASRVINFALGEWVMLGSLLTAAGAATLGLSLGGALGFAGLGMVGLALVFSRVVLRRLVGRPLISLIMVTLGLGALMRGSAALLMHPVPGAVALPIPINFIWLLGVPVATDRLVAAAIAALVVGLIGWFYQHSRTGLALRAVADDPQAAMTMGIDVDRHIGIVWAMAGVISVVGGVLWTFVAGSGFGVALVGLKIFPIVIIGGLDSIPGCIVGAMIIGMLESLAAGYLDPILGGGFGTVACYLLLLAMLFARPEGLFGSKRIARV